MAGLPTISDPSGQGNGVPSPEFALPANFEIKDGDSQETINHKRQLQSTWKAMGDDAHVFGAGAVADPSSF